MKAGFASRAERKERGARVLRNGGHYGGSRSPSAQLATHVARSRSHAPLRQ
jgi:hypothetical protein